MKVAVMQPYLFPYIGYYQLISAVDAFVVFDDVNFIKKGWINRNRILLNGKDHRFTLPLVKASQNKLINEIDMVPDQAHKKKLLDLIGHAYKKSPEYKNVFPAVKEIVLNEENNLLKYLKFSLARTADFLGIKTRLLLSSAIDKGQSLKGQDKIISICKELKAGEYFNLMGGSGLYDKDIFRKSGITLSFLKTREIRYAQFKNDFIPNLSIVDVLMFNPLEAVRGFLREFDLV